MSTAQVELPPKLIPVFTGEADVRGAFGGRGSAKTRSFALMSAVRTHMWDKAGRGGLILCGRQFMNSLEDSSLEEVKAAIRSKAWLLPHFDIGEKYVATKSGRISYTFSGLDRSIDAIKSKARILLGWVDEAEPVTEEAWVKLIPTLREEDSELWVTWNPELKSSATNKRFRDSNDPRYRIVEMNWRDNPWFPAKLERERQRDLSERPDQYDHIWEGGYKTVNEGAYYAKALLAAKQEGRICRLSHEPMLPIRAFHDIGGAGAKSDAYTIWIVQWVGKEIRLLDYYESRGQVLAEHAHWMRERGWARAVVHLPHDGVNPNNITGKRYVDHWRDAGFNCAEPSPNAGTGAAMQRVEAARRLFPRCWFDEARTEAGRAALGWYHARIDEKRGTDLGPEHDWSSHGADAFGEMCVAYREPSPEWSKPIEYDNRGIV